MKKRTAVITCLIAAIIFVAIGIGWARIVQKRRQFVWRPPARSQNNAADDKRTLRENAKQYRDFVKTEYPRGLEAFTTLDDMAKAADVIVIGTAKSNISKLSENEKEITLDYQMVAEKIYKGNLNEKDVFTVSLPGGKVIFPDGSTAGVSTPWFKKMQDGKTYLLFLKRVQEKSFTTVGGPRGLFQIPTDATSRNIQIHTLIADDPMLKYKDMEVRAFLREVKQTVAKATNK
jgi:hypothetical protein